MSLTKLEVGQVYPGWKRGAPERVQFDYSNSGGMLLLAYNQPTAKEVKEVKDGDVKLGLATVDDVFFVLAKFGNEQWTDAPYHAALSKPFDLPELPEDGKEGYAVTVVMIDNLTGIVKVIRLVAMPYDMSLHFATVVTRQKAESGSFVPIIYDRAIAEAYAMYSTEMLVKTGVVYK